MVLIIQQRLIKDSGHITIFFGICGTSKQSTKNGPSDPLFITKNTSTNKQTYGRISEKSYLCTYGHLISFLAPCRHVLTYNIQNYKMEVKN